MNTKTALVLVPALMVHSLACFAGEPNDDRESGVLARLAESSVRVGASWIGEYSAIVQGGVERTDGFRDLLTIDVGLDLERLLGVERTQVFAQLMSVNPSRGGSGVAGDFGGYSNIEIDRSLDAVYELWVEHEFDEIGLRVKFGKVDANSEFAAVDIAGGFSNSSAGFSPTIFALPTYPDPAVSLNLFLELSDTIELGYGFYDGATGADGVTTGGRGFGTFFGDSRSNDWFHIAQLRASWDCGSVTVGGWHHTGRFTAFDGREETGAHGFFAAAEHQLVADRVHVFGQLAWAPEDLSEAHWHCGVGVVVDRLICDKDQAGVYVSFVDLSDETGAVFADNETAIDVYYAYEINSNVTIRPEAQYIAQPSGGGAGGGAGDVIVLGGRLEISF